jgi:hypothetical protein
MKHHEDTPKQLDRLVRFRQAIYAQGFVARRDALFNLLDALLCTGPVPSLPYLSLSPCFVRRWPSLYAALEDGRLEEAWLQRFLAQQVPDTGLQVFALDTTAWARPRATTLPDRQYGHQPSPAVNGGSIYLGYRYSLLAWSPEVGSSWSLPVDVRRVSPEQSAPELGVQQIQGLVQARVAGCGLDIIAADSHYDRAPFWRAQRGQPYALLIRLPRHRVFYRPLPPEPGPRRRGRPRVYGPRFGFRDPATWGEPDEECRLTAPGWGEVRLRRWNGLYDRQGRELLRDLVRADIHQERDDPPPGIWLGWQAPPQLPEGVRVSAETIWQAYQHRWPVEPGIRFSKQWLGWTQPQLQSAEAGDRWSVLVALAVWVLYWSAGVVADQPRPWQKRQETLTPQRVQQGMAWLITQIGTPARAPKQRGKSPGWPAGRPRTPKPRYPAVKKRPVATEKA